MTKRHADNQTRRGVVLRGIGASRGKSVGIVRIVHNIQGLAEVQFGDVLVMPMTNPDMVFAVRKAVAVVTDVGGMLCHAGIISRELGIPCVVGAGSATKILKEGMTVEVDGTNGVVIQRLQEEKAGAKREGLRKMTTEREFTIFGQKVKSVSLKMNRDKPICPEIWDGPWPQVDLGKEYKWIPARPEITGEPIASLVLSGIERIPYAFGFDTDPLFFRFHNCTHYLRLDRIDEILSLLIGRFENRDEDFFAKYRQSLLQSYGELDKAAKEVERLKHRFEETNSEGLLDILKRWWKVHDNFFSLTYLIQSMGDDIVWPRIRKILAEAVTGEVEVNECVAILSMPRTETTALTFFKETSRLVGRSSERIKSLLFSDLGAKETIAIIGEIEGGKGWLKQFKKFVDKWGWVRDRLLYLEPLDQEEKMLAYIKNHFAPETTASDPGRTIAEYNECVKKLEELLSKESMKKLLFYLDMGSFLQKERNDHYFIFLRTTDAIRHLLLELGKRLRDQELFEDERDIFFVFAGELFDLFSPRVPREEKEGIASKIPNRMTAFSHMSKLKLHDRSGYDPDGVPERDDEYY